MKSVTQLKKGESGVTNDSIPDLFAVAKKAGGQVYHRGNWLYSAGDDFQGLYVLVSGSAKSFVVSESGEEHITGFHMPGDILGLDGFDTRHHAYTIDFLETSSVRFISLAQLDRQLGESPPLNRYLFNRMSHAIKEERYIAFTLCHLDSEQRIASFLLDISGRFEELGFSRRIFNLSMSRVDIANHLGMTIETVSRLFKRLQEKSIIESNRRQVRIIDLGKLRACLVNSGGEKSAFYATSQVSQAEYARESA